MQNEHLLNKIRQSAESAEVPESLEPEAIQKRLEEAPSSKRHFPSYRLTNIAACFAVFFCLAAVLFALTRSNSDPASEACATEAEVDMTELVSEEAADMALVSDSEGTKLNAIASIKSYDTLYDKLQTLYEYTMDAPAAAEEEAVAEDTAMAAGDEAAEMDTAEAAVTSEDSGSYTRGFSGTASAENSVETAAAPAEGSEGTADYSDTNVAVKGIDEGDIVKTDGTCIYILKDGQKLHIVDAASMEQINTLTPGTYDESIEEMYLDGTTLHLIGTGCDTTLESDDSDSCYVVSSPQTTTLYTYDVSDPKNITLSGKVSQDGYYRSSRKSGSYIYLFTQYYPNLPNDKTQLEKYVPSAGGKVLPLDCIYIPEICNQDSSLVISSIDARNPDRFVDSKSVVSGAEQFYVSSETIYISNNDWNNKNGEQTQIVSFSYKDGSITAQSAGTVPGYLNDNFSMDEYENHLRVVSTSWNDKKCIDINALYVLNEDLKIVGQITDLAPDETIRSARFMGDTGYFVTYRQTDPLFSVDLSDPENPQISGELKITGFSEYLHFYDENLLLGIGWETDPDTLETIGLKLSMFDISDPTNVKEKDRFVIKDIYSSPATYNYKAVMIDPEKNIFGFACEADAVRDSESQNYCVFSYDKEKGFVNEMTFNLNNSSGDYLDTGVVRGLYINDSFYLCTDTSVLKFDMQNEYQLTGRVDL